MPIEDGLPDIPLEGGTVNTSHAKTVPSSSAKSPLQQQQQYTSTIDDSKLATVTSSISSNPSTTTTSSPVYSPISSPRSPSSSSMDGISILHKRSRGSLSSHSGSGSDTDDDERATKRHQSDSDVDSVASDENRTHEPIVTIKYGEHSIRVLTIEDGTRVVVAKDFLLLTGISKENCARTTKNLIEGKDKRMMHVPSSYCMNKGQQAVVLTTSGLSQLLVTSRRLKQSSALQAWIKQTLMPALQGHATTATSTNNTATDIHMQSQSQAHNKTNTNTKSKNGRTIVKAKRSVASNKSPSASPVVKAAPAPLALSPTTSSFSPFIRSPSSSSSSASSSPIRPTFSRLSSSDSESTMSDASTSSSTPSSPASSSSGMQELSAAADMMLITPANPIKPLPMHFPMPMPFMPTFSRMPLYRTPLMPLPTMTGMGIRPTFTAGKIWAAGA